MNTCICDWDSPTIYNCVKHKAKKYHKCSECNSQIYPGETYWRTFGVWDGYPKTYKTCFRCNELEDFVRKHIPCLCISHGNLIEDCLDAAYYSKTVVPGLLFGTYRRIILIRRNAKRGITYEEK